MYTAEACSSAEKNAVPNPIIPSELGSQAASRLIDQVRLLVNPGFDFNNKLDINDLSFKCHFAIVSNRSIENHFLS